MTDDRSGDGPSLARVRTSLERTTERIEELEAALKDKQTQLSHQRERIDRLAAELLNKDRRIQQLETENDQLQSRIGSIETTLDDGESPDTAEN